MSLLKFQVNSLPTFLLFHKDRGGPKQFKLRHKTWVILQLDCCLETFTIQVFEQYQPLEKHLQYLHIVHFGQAMWPAPYQSWGRLIGWLCMSRKSVKVRIQMWGHSCSLGIIWAFFRDAQGGLQWSKGHSCSLWQHFAPVCIRMYQFSHRERLWSLLVLIFSSG